MILKRICSFFHTFEFCMFGESSLVERISHKEDLNCILLASSLLVSFSKPIGGESQRSRPSYLLLQWVFEETRREYDGVCN